MNRVHRFCRPAACHLLSRTELAGVEGIDPSVDGFGDRNSGHRSPLNGSAPRARTWNFRFNGPVPLPVGAVRNRNPMPFVSFVRIAPDQSQYLAIIDPINLIDFREIEIVFWNGGRGSNPHFRFGRPEPYHWTTSAKTGARISHRTKTSWTSIRRAGRLHHPGIGSGGRI